MLTRLASTGLVLAVALGAATAVNAQVRVASLTGVQGTVLVGKGEGMSAAVNGQTLAPGARVVSTNNSRAVIAYDNGCDVPVGANSRATVRSDASCAQLKSDVVILAQAPGAIGGAPAAAAPAAAGSSAPGFAALGLGAAGFGMGAYHAFKDDNQPVSPN